MKRSFGLIVGIVFFVALIVFGSRRISEKTAEAAKATALGKLKTEYAERVAWVRLNPDEKSYRDEVQNFFGWYFKEVNEFINKHGGNRKFDDYLQELAERQPKAGKGGKGGDDDKDKDKRAIYDVVRKQFDEFNSRNYSPLWTATDHGIRLDVVTASAISSGGEKKIRFQLVVWGLPREERVNDKNVRSVRAMGSFNVNAKLFDAKDKLAGEFSISGDPGEKVEWPERFVPFFPSQIVLGHYDVDLLMAEAVKTEITFTISSRSPSGGEIVANLVWKLDVPAEWKLAAGEKWKGATDSVRPEEEINEKVQPAGGKGKK